MVDFFTVIFTGSRSYDKWPLVYQTLGRQYHQAAIRGKCLYVKVGDCKTGLDHQVYRWLMAMDSIIMPIKFKVFEADWDKHGTKAGPIRNHEMVDDGPADACFAFPDYNSKGTVDCASYAHKKSIPVVFPEMQLEWRNPPEWFKWTKIIAS